MNRPEITILLPGIRKHRWDMMYDSICESTKRSFELIICGPYSLTEKLQSLKNVKYVKDFGSPMRASNIAALLAEGKLITWISDDSLLIENSLDQNIDLLYNMGNNDRSVVVAKYYEGKDGTHKPLQPDNYFKVNGAPCTASPMIPSYWWIFNVAIMHTSFFNELGGWDCGFEACPMGHTDMAIRAQAMGANVVMSNYPLLDCDHDQSDHKPIEVAQLGRDEPKFQRRYRNPNWVHREKCIDINNWKDAPIIWKERFENE